MKIIIVDTNVVLHDPQSIYRFGDNEVVIPAIVLEEVDSKKRQQDEVGRNARVFSKYVDKLTLEGEISEGVRLENGGTLRVELNHISFDKLKEIFMEKTNDNRILAVAKNLQVERQDCQVIVVSNDVLMRVKAKTLGLEAQPYESDRLVENLEGLHKGNHELLVMPEFIDEFYSHKSLNFEQLVPTHLANEAYCVQDFFILKDILGSSKSAVARLTREANQLKLVPLYKTSGEPVYGITAKNAQQKMLFELLLDKDISLVCVSGRAGTGKTLLALAAALAQISDSGGYKGILAARPVIPMGKDIGFLPGDKDEKLAPWMQPIFDNLEFLFQSKSEKDFENQMLKLNTILRVEALTYIRGRSIPKQFLIIDEAQNLTAHEVKTIITRSGEGTKVVLLGDPEQIDHPYLDSTNNGLTYVIERMKKEEYVGIINLEKTERSTLAENAAKLL